MVLNHHPSSSSSTFRSSQHNPHNESIGVHTRLLYKHSFEITQ
jgi:hypothetical protein